MTAKAFEMLTQLGEAQAEMMAEHDRKLTDWWNHLSLEEKEKAFSVVSRKIYDAAITEDLSYREALYQKFGFPPDMYGVGIDCGYNYIHNALQDYLNAERHGMLKYSSNRGLHLDLPKKEK